MQLENKIAELEKQLASLREELNSTKNYITYNGLDWMLSTKYLNYQETIEYAHSLPGGWRLPTVQELVGVYDYVEDKCKIEFEGCFLMTHWCSTGHTVALGSGNLCKYTRSTKECHPLLVKVAKE